MKAANLARWAVVARLAEDLESGRLVRPSDLDEAARKHLTDLSVRFPGLPAVDLDFVAQAIPASWRKALGEGNPPKRGELALFVSDNALVSWTDLAKRAEKALKRVLKHPPETLETLHAIAREPKGFDAVLLEATWSMDFPPTFLREAQKHQWPWRLHNEPQTEQEAGAFLRRLDEGARADPVGYAPVLASRDARRVLLVALEKWPSNIRLYSMVSLLAEHPRVVVNAWNKGLRDDALKEHMESHRQEVLGAVPRAPIGPPSASVDPNVDDLPLTLEFSKYDETTTLDVQVLEARLARMGFKGAIADGGLRSQDFPEDMFLCRDLRDIARHNLETTGKTHVKGKDILSLELDRRATRTSWTPEFTEFPLPQSKLEGLPPEKQIDYMVSLFSAIFRATSDAVPDSRLTVLFESLHQALTLTLSPNALGLWSGHSVSWINYAADSLLKDIRWDRVAKAIPAELRTAVADTLTRITKPYVSSR